MLKRLVGLIVTPTLKVTPWLIAFLSENGRDRTSSSRTSVGALSPNEFCWPSALRPCENSLTLAKSCSLLSSAKPRT